MTNPLQKQQGEVKALIQSDRFKGELAASLPKHLTPERFARIAITAVSRNPKIAECTQASLFRCLLDLSAAGLEPDGRRAHLIPYGKECTLIIDYKGLVELIRRSGDVVYIRAETVCESDEFEWLNGTIQHKVDWRNPRGPVQAAYAEARLKSGEVQTATMTVDEIEAIRKRSRGGNNGPWQSDWGEMAKKTVVRRLSKMLPLSYEVMEHIDRVDRPIAGMRSANDTPGEAKGSVWDSFTPEPKPEIEESQPEPDPEPEPAEPKAADDQIEAIKTKMLDAAIGEGKVFAYAGIEHWNDLTAKGAFALLENFDAVAGGK